MRGHDLFRYAAIVACTMCYLTIILGGNVITTDNGLACPAWPSCFGNGNFLPSFTGGAAIEWSHRVAAFFRALLRLSLASLALVVTEALLGGVIIETSLLAEVVLVHLAIATALFGLLLVIALLANLRQMPRRWVEWARKATEEGPARRHPAAAPGPADPAGGSVADLPVAVSAAREG